MFHQKSTQRGPGGKYMNASEKAKKAEEGTISASKPKVQKMDSDEDESSFECYNKSDGKPLHVDIDKEVTERGPALALLPNNLEEIYNNGETKGGNGNISVHRSNRTFKPPDRLSSVPYF